MSPEIGGEGVRSIAAEGPHCGICSHVYFGDDWDRTPYCTAWDRPTEIDVGDVCSKFRTRLRPDEDIEIDWADESRGTVASFFPAFRNDERYGLLCGKCQTLDVMVDTMGRVKCTECGNEHKPREWDAAYL